MHSPVSNSLNLFLERLLRRSALSPEEQQAILSLPGELERLEANRDFVSPGDRVSHACLMVSGMAGRFDQGADGTRQITALHFPGDMCDLRSVVLPLTETGLQALAPSAVMRIPHEAIRVIATQFPGIAEALWRDCMVDAALLAEWVVNIGRRTARGRVAHLLCELTYRMNRARWDGPIIIDIQFSQQQLAEATGLTPVHVNRTLQSLRADGLVDWRNRHVILPDFKALCEVAEFDTTYLHLGVDDAPAGHFRLVDPELVAN